MHVVITGGAGFIGKRLARRLLDRGELTDSAGTSHRIDTITLFDVVAATGFDDPRITVIAGDIARQPEVIRLVESADSVFHLAAVVSGEAEANLSLGMRVNLEGTQNVVEALRALPRSPKLVFASSVAVYGGDLPDLVTDATTPTPQTSYGTQKFMGELLVQDFTRKGLLDGRSVRLPTVVVRPGKPNKAASSFASAVIREPLAGMRMPCPVPRETPVFLTSPATVVDNLIHAHELPASRWGWNRSILLPGITVTVDQMVTALEQVAGRETVDLIDWEPDPVIMRIVETWPGHLHSDRATDLGFHQDTDFADVIRAHMADERIFRTVGA